MRENKYKVWCHNKGEWERDRVALSPSGTLLHETRRGWMSLKETTHTVVFYTGLHDKNGKEIYEGDVLGDVYVLGEKHNNSEVIFKDGAFGLLIKSGINNNHEYEPCLYEVDARFAKVIGNVFENPELKEE